ncbi:MAG: type II secretion system protein GspM [Betaproteobacteria bacterium]
MSAPATVRARAAAAWRGLAPRERRLVAVAAALVALALLWLLAVQPAWRTLARAPAEIDRLDAQLQAMQRLAAEAQARREATPVPPEQAQAALQAATARLGPKAQLTLSGERAVVRFDGVAPGALREWLAEARAGARARPVAAALQRAGQGFSGTLELAFEGAPR